MKVFKRINATYKLNRLPKLKAVSFDHPNGIGYSGSIVRRRIKGPVKIYWHYAFIYGFDERGRILLIENNEDGVECISWADFNPEGVAWEFYHIETNSDNFKSIMSRARARAPHSYNSNKNNCEHFVNYCIFQKLESIQINNTKLVANAAMLYIEMRLLNTPDPGVPMILEYANKIRQVLGMERGAKEIDEIVNKRIGLLKKNESANKPKVSEFKQFKLK